MELIKISSLNLHCGLEGRYNVPECRIYSLEREVERRMRHYPEDARGRVAERVGQRQCGPTGRYARGAGSEHAAREVVGCLSGHESAGSGASGREWEIRELASSSGKSGRVWTVLAFRQWAVSSDACTTATRHYCASSLIIPASSLIMPAIKCRRRLYLYTGNTKYAVDLSDSCDLSRRFVLRCARQIGRAHV